MTTRKKSVKKTATRATAPNIPTDINACMAAIMRDITHIGKTEDNKAQGFKFRGIDQTYNVLHGIMAKYGVFCTASVISKDREERTTARGGVLAFTTLHMTYTFHAPDGSTVSTSVIGEGMDSGDKSSNKAMAIAHKYALLQAFLIPTEEQKDPDYEVHEVAPRIANVPDSVINGLAKAASFGANTFREEWKKTKPEYRKAISKDRLDEWKSSAESFDLSNPSEDPNE